MAAVTVANVCTSSSWHYIVFDEMTNVTGTFSWSQGAYWSNGSPYVDPDMEMDIGL